MTKTRPKDIFSLSPLQEGLFFQYLADKNSDAYFVQVSYRMKGKMDIDIVRRCLETLFERHDILRTAFVYEGLRRMYQVVLEDRRPAIEFRDLRDLEPEQREKEVAAWQREDKRRKFDLKEDVLMRMAVLQIADQEFELIWSHHHIIFDGWCQGILIEEFNRIYEALEAGETPSLPPAVQYHQYIKWLERQDKFAGGAFWEQYMAGFERQTGIPGKKDRLAGGRYQNAEIRLWISPEKTEAVRLLGQRLTVTMSTFIQTVWGLLLGRLNDTDDVVFGKVVSVRPSEIAGIETSVGLYINTVPMRVTALPDQPFEELLNLVQGLNAETGRFQHFSMAEIQAASRVKHGLIDHVVVFGNYPGAEQLYDVRESESQVSAIREMNVSQVRSFEQVNYDFSIHATCSEALLFRFNFNAEVFEEEDIRRLSRRMEYLIDQLVSDPAIPIGQLDILLPEEIQELERFAGYDKGYREDALPGLFRAMAAANPDSPAVQSGKTTLTYRELDQAAGRLAGYLRESCGFRPGQVAGVMLDRSVHAVVSILGIWKAGGTYLPLDTQSPAARLERILKDSRAALLVTQSDLMFSLPDFSGWLTVIDIEWEMIAGLEPAEPEPLQPADIAYIIYTSGTSGEPKGVPVRHESISDRIQYHNDFLGIAHQDSVLHFASLNFDASLVEIFMALAAGGTLVLADRQVKSNPDLLLKLIRESGVTIAILPPAYLKLFGKISLGGLRLVISTGEAAALGESLFHAATLSLYNGYGPSEACIGATFHKVDPRRSDEYASRKGIPIGQPFANTRVYVMDRYQRLVPPGWKGEIGVSGIGVASGYLGQSELTAEKFIPDPYSKSPAYTQLYRTGDLGRWNKNGELEFLGRLDEQVQIRGIRVETREIEASIRKFPGVEDSLVLPIQMPDESTVLMAFTCTRLQIGPREIRRFLGTLLPEYMIPAGWVMLKAFPVNHNGKVDRQALMNLAGREMESQRTEYRPPTTPDELKMADLWEEVLEKNEIGLDDNFFDLGGHSLKATQLVSRIYREFGRKIGVNDVFNFPTVRSLLDFIFEAAAETYVPIRPVETTADYEASPSQKRTWILTQFDGASVVYNIPGAFRAGPSMDPELLAAAVDELAARHEILRTTFLVRDGELRQRVHPPHPDRVEKKRMNWSETPDADQRLADLLEGEAQIPFDLENGPLFRIKFVSMPSGERIVIYTLHHIIADGWSMQNLLNELALLYHDLEQGKMSSLPPLAIQYKDYSAWLQQQLTGENLNTHRQYWKARFAGDIPVLDLPADRPRPPVKTYKGAGCSLMIGKQQLDELRKTCRRQDLSVFMALITAFKALLSRLSGQQDIVVGTLISGRQHPDLERQIGYYANTLPLRTTFEPEDTLRRLGARVKETVLEAFRHEIYPFDYLVDEVSVLRDISRTPVFDVILTHQKIDLFNQATEPGLAGGIENLSTGGNNASRFDLEWYFTEYDETLTGHLVYNTDLFDAATINRITGYFEKLLEAVARDEDQPLWAVPLSDAAEDRRWLMKMNDTFSPWPAERSIVEFLERHAAQRPGYAAVRCEDNSLTYSELNATVNRMAGWLKAVHRVQPGDQVALCLPRSEWLIAGMLALFKIKAVYLPVDPELPPERIRYMIGKAGVKLALVAGNFPEGVFDEIRTADITTGWQIHPPDNLTDKPDRSAPAYLLFTSGSTGFPKGALIGHGSMLNHLIAKAEDCGMDEDAVVAQTATQSFDISIWQSLSALIHGGCTVVYPSEVVKDPVRLMQQVDYDEITVLQVVPSYLAELMEAIDNWQGPNLFRRLRCMSTVGEALPFALTEKWFDKFFYTRFVNSYGPTETADGATHHIMTTCPPRPPVPIGKPVRNCRIYVLDPYGGICLPGVKGEIFIAGAGVGFGYVNDPEKTTAAFVPDPFFPGETMYRTGDIGRWTNDGWLEFAGRRDAQIKLRGHRIELGEIEQALYRIPAVREAIAALWDDPHGGKILAAWLTLKSGAEFESAELKHLLATHLPAYMIPGRFIVLDQFPLTASGKIDRKALPSPILEHKPAGSEEVDELTTETEKAVAEIWKEILGGRSYSRDDNFFEVGGHSFKAIKMQARLFKTLNIGLSVREIFSFPTIRELAAHIDQKSAVAEELLA